MNLYLLMAVDPGAVMGPGLIILVVIIACRMLWKTRSAESRAELREKYGQQGPNPPTRGAGD